MLAVATGLVNTLLALGGQDGLDVYFTVNIIVYLAITLLYVYINPRARRALDTVGYMLFSGFLVVVVVKVMDILAGE
jgi:hypothetical protein